MRADEWNGLPSIDASAGPVMAYVAENGFVDTDGELVFIGPAAELAFGRRHFMGTAAAFTAAAVHIFREVNLDVGGGV